jgi:hypothetical protein
MPNEHISFTGAHRKFRLLFFAMIFVFFVFGGILWFYDCWTCLQTFCLAMRALFAFQLTRLVCLLNLFGTIPVAPHDDLSRTKKAALRLIQTPYI